jgi:hypothetical protein
MLYGSIDFIFHFFYSSHHSYISLYDNHLFRCPIGKQISLLLNSLSLFLSNICTCIMKFYYFQHHLRARKKERQKERKKKGTEKVMGVLLLQTFYRSLYLVRFCRVTKNQFLFDKSNKVITIVWSVSFLFLRKVYLVLSSSIT